MLAELFKDKSTGENTTGPDVTETEIWKRLGMDKLGDKMIEDGMSNQNPVFMGTGHTHNACYGCANTSSRAAGCTPIPGMPC